jgi:hypothetical protein
MIEVVIGDVHARPELLRAFLEAIGALDSRGHRREGFWIVQVGDLLDRRAEAAVNLRTAKLAADSLDVVLAGNHEVDMLAAPGTRHRRALATLARRGWPHAAAEVGGWLVTHGGVHPELSHGLPPAPSDCAVEINDRWHHRAAGKHRPRRRAGSNNHRPSRASRKDRRVRDGDGDPLFDWVGPARGGVSPYGGLFWSAASEWPSDGQTPWGQICGHMPQPSPRLLPGPRWLIDLQAEPPQLAGLVRNPREQGWSPVLVRRSRRGAVLTGHLPSPEIVPSS